MRGLPSGLCPQAHRPWAGAAVGCPPETQVVGGRMQPQPGLISIPHSLFWNALIFYKCLPLARINQKQENWMMKLIDDSFPCPGKVERTGVPREGQDENNQHRAHQTTAFQTDS